ncbi:MAG TPA: hypothetical protein VMT88_11395 [Actinomycetes bacterium]|nr:hypothetical protein [Actinomycetes bacterium]
MLKRSDAGAELQAVPITMNRRSLVLLAMSVLVLSWTPTTVMLSEATAEAAVTCDNPPTPVLKNFTIRETSVDVRRHSSFVHVKARLSEMDWGIVQVRAQADSPSLVGTTINEHKYLGRSAGTAHDGTWKGKIRIPKYTHDGKWRVHLDVTDSAGYGLPITSPQLAHAGYSARFKVLAHPDLVAPKIHSFSFTPRSVDTRDGPTSVKATAVITDEGGSNVSSVGAFFNGAMDQTGQFGSIATLYRIPGTDKFVGAARIPRRADREVTVKWLAHLSVSDGSENGKFLWPDDLRKRGWPSSLAVLNRSDPGLPKLMSFNFSPNTVANAVETSVPFSADIKDAGSGVAYGAALIEGTNTGTVVGDLRLVSGSPHDGTFEGSLEMRACSPVGTYTIRQIEVTDRTGNYRTYDTAALQSRGFPVTLTVTP